MSNQFVIIERKTGRVFQASNQLGYTARVYVGGPIRVWDDVAGHWTTCHSLTDAQITRLRRDAKNPGHHIERDGE